MGKKSFLSSRDDLMQFWDWEANEKENIFPNDITISSKLVVNWKCELGHLYRATVCSKNYGYGCPYCSNKKILVGYNDFGSKHPELISEWDCIKNEVDPFSITENNGKKYWWKCKFGHLWAARTTDRIKGHGCPYCSGRSVVEGTSDLFTTNPKIASEWNYNRNGNLKPDNVKPGSKKKVWWKCDKGHEWQSTIKNRTLNKSNCPFCTGTRVIQGETDLQTLCPNLSLEWNYSKNLNTLPQETACFSNVKVWWIGKCGHEWQDTPGHRVFGRGCPVCNKQNRTSFPEQAIYYYTLKHYPDVQNSYTEIFSGTMELDIYIPSLKIGIEYDGKAWHNTDKAYEREKRKYEICHGLGIKLIRIKEATGCLDYSTGDVIIKTGIDIQETLAILGNYITITDVNIDRDRLEILDNYLNRKKGESLEILYPEIAEQWNYCKNLNLKPNMFFPESGEKVWWKCEKGHEWKMPIRERTSGKCGCPYCSNHRLLTGFNDLSTVSPQIASEWDYGNNGGITPNTIKAFSTYRAKWICKFGHRWTAKVRDRIRRNSGCPECYKSRKSSQNPK